MDVVESLELGKPYLLRVTDGKRTWKLPAYEVTDKTLRAIVFDPKSKKLKCLDDIERDVRNTMDQEVPSAKIGELIMNRLKDFDEVAYIRFASVCRKFADISSFLEELKVLQAHKAEEEKKQDDRV